MSTEIAVLQDIQTTPAVIKFDYEAARALVAAMLDPFKSVVTEDTIAQAKKEKASINKLKGEIDDAKKIKAAEATVQVREFEQKMKDLSAMCADGYAHLNDQINKFESVVKARCLGFLQDELLDCWERLGVAEEFRKSTPEKLAILTNCNDAGLPTKKAKEAVLLLARDDLNSQNLVAMRVAKLESACFKAGLKVPLGRVHIEGFIALPEDDYKRRLEALIAAEIERSKAAEQIKPADKEPEHPAAPAIIERSHSAELGTHLYSVCDFEAGKVTYEITVKIHVSVDPHITADAIAESARKQLLERAGFKKVSSIYIAIIG